MYTSKDSCTRNADDMEEFFFKNWFCLNNQQQIMLHTIAESLECYSESDTVTAVNVIDAHQMNCVHTQKK